MSLVQLDVGEGEQNPLVGKLHMNISGPSHTEHNESTGGMLVLGLSGVPTKGKLATVFS